MNTRVVRVPVNQRFIGRNLAINSPTIFQAFRLDEIEVFAYVPGKLSIL